MITVLFVISLAILIVGIVLGVCNDWYDAPPYVLTIVGIIAVLVTGIWDCVQIQKLATADIIDQKIAMYEEENSEIEAQIDLLVKRYMEFEKETYDSLKSESTMTLVSLFPELKSDELVMKQIEIYQKNWAKIKSLKEEKLDLAKAKWQVYFGR